MVTELPLPDAVVGEPRLRIIGPADLARDDRAEPPAGPLADEAVIAAIVAGDAAALGRLYDRRADAVFAIMLRIVGDRETAEELLQEVFLRVWQQAALYDPRRGTVRHWLQGIAHNLALNEVRRRQRRPQAAPPAPGERGDDTLGACIDPEPEPAETAWRAARDAGLVAPSTSCRTANASSSSSTPPASASRRSRRNWTSRSAPSNRGCAAG